MTCTGTVLLLLTVPRMWQQQTLGSRTKLLSTTVGNCDVRHPEFV